MPRAQCARRHHYTAATSPIVLEQTERRGVDVVFDGVGVAVMRSMAYPSLNTAIS